MFRVVFRVFEGYPDEADHRWLPQEEFYADAAMMLFNYCLKYKLFRKNHPGARTRSSVSKLPRCFVSVSILQTIQICY